MNMHHESLQKSMTNFVSYAQAATHDNAVGPHVSNAMPNAK